MDVRKPGLDKNSDSEFTDIRRILRLSDRWKVVSVTTTYNLPECADDPEDAPERTEHWRKEVLGHTTIRIDPIRGPVVRCRL